MSEQLRRPRIASASTFFSGVESEQARRWLDSLPYYTDLEDHRKVAESDHVAWMEPDTRPIETTVEETHRTGTCFDNESEEMRNASVGPIREYLDADVVLHEVRHQRSGYHTDLVFASIDPSGFSRRREVIVGTDPLHEPIQRFRVWWYINEYGPMPLSKAESDGRYSDPSKNKQHIEWLLNHGYLAQTASNALTAIVPPSICTLHAVELKLRDWEKALEQAARARRYDGPEWRSAHWKDRYGYADYSWVALDAGAIEPALRHVDRFQESGVGLLAVTEGGTVIEHVEAEERPRGRYTRDRAYAESQVWGQVGQTGGTQSQEESSENDQASWQETLITAGQSE